MTDPQTPAAAAEGGEELETLAKGLIASFNMHTMIGEQDERRQHQRDVLHLLTAALRAQMPDGGGESQSRDGEYFAGVYHKAKSASEGPTRQDAIDAGWNAVAAAALRAQSDSPDDGRYLAGYQDALVDIAAGDSPSPSPPGEAAVSPLYPETALPTMEEIKALLFEHEERDAKLLPLLERLHAAAIQQLHSRASEGKCENLERCLRTVAATSASREVSEEDVVCCVEEKNELHNQIRALTDERDGLLAWKRDVDASLNSGDGTYRCG